MNQIYKILGIIGLLVLIGSVYADVSPEWKYKTGDNVNSVAISSDGKYVVVGSYRIYFFDKSGKLLWNKSGEFYIHSVAASLNGKYIVAGEGWTPSDSVYKRTYFGQKTWGSNDEISYNIYLFNNKGDLLWKYKTYGPVSSVAITPDGKYIVAGSIGGYIYLFNNKGDLLWKYKTYGNVRSISITRGGEYIVVGSWEDITGDDWPDSGYIYFFDKDGNLLWKYKTGDEVSSVAITPDGNYVVAGSADNNVYFFDKDGNLLWKYKTGSGVWSVAITPDGNYILSGSGGSIYFFNKNGKLLWKYHTEDEINSVAMTSDGSYVVAGSCDGHIYSFDKNGNLLWKYKTGGEVSSVTITSDGKYVVAGSDDDYVYFFDNNVYKLIYNGLLAEGDLFNLTEGYQVKIKAILETTINNTDVCKVDVQILKDGNVIAEKFDKTPFLITYKLPYKNITILVKNAFVTVDSANSYAELEIYYGYEKNIIKDKINQLEQKINQYKSEGTNITEAISLLNKAKEEYNKGNYNNAIKYVEQSQKVAEEQKKKEDIKNQITQLEDLLNKYKSEGVDVEEAFSLISKAETELKNGNYNKSLEYLNESQQIAEQNYNEYLKQKQLQTMGAIFLGTIFLILMAVGGSFIYYRTKHQKKIKTEFLQELNKIDDLINKGLFKKALEECNNLLSKYPKFKDEINQRIQKCNELIKRREFEKEINKIEHNLIKNKKFKEALEKFKELKEKYPEFIKEIEEWTNKCDKWANSLYVILERAKKYHDEGDEYYYKNRTEDAINKWKLAVEEYKKSLKIVEELKDRTMESRIKDTIGLIVDKVINAEIEGIKRLLG